MQHKAVGLGNIHQIHNYEFETIGERDAFIPSLDDLKLICLVNSPFSYYSLKSVEPIEWKPLSTVTINLEDFSVYSQTETLELLNAKQSSYDITSSEFSLGYKRGGKEVFGIEVDCGALPNNTTKTITIPNYETSYSYWVDGMNSYTKNTTTGISFPILATNSLTAVSNNILITLDNGNLKIQTASNKSTYDKTKIVLNYTKG